MYFTYFGLAQAPFKITPDTRLFFPGGNRGAVLESLVYAVTSGEGIVKVVGEVGSGKTMLCRMLARELPESIEIVYLPNPSLSPEHILHAIAFELKLRAAPSDSRLKVLHTLQEYLIQRHARNIRVVTFIEEAQGMPIETLEEIRLLSNLETQDEKLLQIVMFGQPELDETLANPRIRQLKERITYSFYLTPFTAPQVAEYLTTRLRACGYQGMGLFTRGAVRRLTHRSRGLVRRINILADKSLLAAYAANAVKVSAGHVRRASRDSEFGTGRRHVGRMITIAACVVAVGGALWWAGGVHLGEGRDASFATRARSGGAPQTGTVARAPEGATDSPSDALPARAPLPALSPLPAQRVPASQRPALGQAREAGQAGKDGRPIE